MKFHWGSTLIGALLMATSDQGSNDAVGLIFGIMVILVSVVVVVTESNRRREGGSYCKLTW